jgi:GNAT superfamily N-acetyltransferase
MSARGPSSTAPAAAPAATAQVRGAAPLASPTTPQPVAAGSARGWQVRAAAAQDATAIAAAVRELLLELGGEPAPASTIADAARSLLEDRRAGALLVAQDGAELVGLLGASWQSALHVPGRYGLIQELWVHPSWRGRALGSDLLDAVFALARELGIARIEVGLPRDGFAGLRATEAFYRGNGFQPLGTRMRRSLP